MSAKCVFIAKEINVAGEVKAGGNTQSTGLSSDDKEMQWKTGTISKVYKNRLKSH